jgi:glycosyltransferase involved in cell wall biosynthesis
MSEAVMEDLRKFEKTKPAKMVIHPLYDNFGEIISKEEARRLLKEKLGVHIGEHEKILLFFGFIRRYKGLDILIRAMAEPGIRDSGIRLLIAGEFYEDSESYSRLINELNISEKLILNTDFVPDGEVQYYLCAADAIVQPYRHATQMA